MWSAHVHKISWRFLNAIILCDQHFIDKIFQRSLYYLSISIFQSKIHTCRLNQFVIRYFQILIWIIFSHIFRCFYGLYIFFSYMSIFHVIWRRESVGIYCKLIPGWIGSSTGRIQLWDISCPNMKHTRNTTWRCISKYIV